MNPIQGNSPIWHDMSGIERLAAQVKANDAKKSQPTVQAIRAQVIASHLLHRVDTSQLGERDGVSIGGCVTTKTPVCPNGFGGDCDYPSCVCADQLAYEQKNRQLEDDNASASLKHLAVMVIASVALLVSAVASSPALLEKAVEVLQSWF